MVEDDFMRICVFADNHFCESSSIIRSQGKKYSSRLENQIQSINWVEELATKECCDMVICLGDFFDKPTLSDQELTALKDIKWNDLPHYIIVGNHESSVNGLSYNSTKALESISRHIVDKITPMSIGGLNVLLMPYIIESERKSLKEYGADISTIIFSHNDIKGLQMGLYCSQEGFSIEDIEQNCWMFINGHIHNGSTFCNNGINLGCLTGLNFSEDAFKYKHNAIIIDIDEEPIGCAVSSMKINYYENPFAYNFYKIEINAEQDLRELERIKNNSILSIKCADYPNLVNRLKETLETYKDKIIEHRIIITHNSSEDVDVVEDFSMNHIEKFIEFCKSRIDDDILDIELGEVCK